MHDGEGSYCGVVPTKQPNKSEPSPAEVVEGRPQTKENTQEPNLCRTPRRRRRPRKDYGVCAVGGIDPTVRRWPGGRDVAAPAPRQSESAKPVAKTCYVDTTQQTPSTAESVNATSDCSGREAASGHGPSKHRESVTRSCASGCHRWPQLNGGHDKTEAHHSAPTENNGSGSHGQRAWSLYSALQS